MPQKYKQHLWHISFENLVELVHKTNNLLSTYEHLDAIYIDFRQAFHMFNYVFLSRKLERSINSS